MKNTDNEIIQSGKASFKIEVPYKLIESGTKQAPKPLIVYLHGFNQTEKSFRKDCRNLLKVHAYHLFIQAPYPIYDRSREKPVSEWGRSWYLYDGSQDQFLRSMDHASRFIGQIITKTIDATAATRTAILGYSMGGYLAGYHAIKWPEHVQDLIICSARYKSELLEGEYEKINHQSILALHGNADKKVESSPQRNEIEGLKQHGIDATFVALADTHKFSQAFIEKILDWLNDKGYTCDPI
ncbi:alpha/beta hydrolase [Rhodohalobacter sp. 8-1]|uniref:alpha/beta hydrolase n=1 Tax=Rhodohalobacter sp. 8-1 TaxID=3131972 RepID=UPI0030ED786F